MDTEKITCAADHLLEVKQLLEEAGLASSSDVIRQVEELQLSLALFARLARKPAA